MPRKPSPVNASQRRTREGKPPAEIQNPEKLKDPVYALALHVARMRRERGLNAPPGSMPPMR